MSQQNPSSLNPEHESRLKESEYYREKQKAKTRQRSEKTWYVQVNDKVIKKTRLKNGSIYSNYVGKYKNFKHLVK